MRELVPPEVTIVEPDPAVCPECHGRGWKVLADGGAGKAVRCGCVQRDRSHDYLAQADIPERYRHCRLSEFDTRPAGAPQAVRDRLTRAYSISEKYIDKFFDLEKKRFRTKGLIYIGKSGTGKTHLAVAVLARLIERYEVRGRFADFTALIHQIQSTFDPTSVESKHAILDPVIHAEILVLDELGAQRPAEWVDDILYLIINTRYLKQLPTLFTTNYPLELKSETRDGFPAQGPSEGIMSDARAARAGPPPQLGSFARTRRRVETDVPLKKFISSTLVSRLFEMTEPVYLPSWDYRHGVMSKRDRIGS